jgi:predicted amidophosphoribosyltransferase
MKTPGSPLDQTIRRYKYEGRHGWSYIFARLLLGHLEATTTPQEVDLVVAMPTWTGPPDQRFGHTEAVLDRGAVEDTRHRWPLDTDQPRAVIATGPHPRSAGGSLIAKQQAAAEFYRVLEVPDPARIAGHRVLVYDDVFTTGHMLNALARKLREAGATDVRAIILARQPWTS